MCVVQPHAAVKVHESERDLHTLHTFEHRLNRQGKGKTKKIRHKCATVAPYFEKIRCKRATVAPYLAASRLRSSFASTSSPSPSKMERGLGGEARRYNCDKLDWKDTKSRQIVK
jgi:hypothetical protein